MGERIDFREFSSSFSFSISSFNLSISVCWWEGGGGWDRDVGLDGVQGKRVRPASGIEIPFE